MKQITIKSVLLYTVAVMLLTLGTASASAQYYMNVVQKDGEKVQYLVSNIDSVYFSDQKGPAVNYEYVDLGLSVNWAAFNVGAYSPEEYGDYYAWGELETKSNYTWTNYKYHFGNDAIYKPKFTKYNTTSTYYGTEDNKTVLDLEDDVANVKWGGSWRMPTKEEQDELLNNCTWTWTVLNGVNGYRVTSNITGYVRNSIFIPAAGYCDETQLVDTGQNGYYLTSSLAVYPQYAYYLGFCSDYYIGDDACRHHGRSVRPVCPSETWANNVSISLNNDIQSLLVGCTYNLTATVKHSNDVIDREVTWTSANPSVATVSETGLVTAISTGSTTITATCLGKTATCTITVILLVSEYVDLGLSVKWATFNVGATKPEEYGDYYAWGETETKTDYSWSTYKWCNGSNATMTKYCSIDNVGNECFTDTLTVLAPEDDVAHVKWGGSWRMPTKAEQDDLRNKCAWTWYDSGNTEFNGVAGYKVTSKIEGYTDRSIFLPAPGYRYGTNFDGVGNGAHYWSSSLVTGYPIEAYFLYFDSEGVDWSCNFRLIGYSVRPVCP